MSAKPDLEAIAMFVRVVDAGTFSRAARGIGVPTSTVSRAIARLEDALGVRLLQRTTRALTLTSEGSAFLTRVQGPLASLNDAVEETHSSQDVPRGTLRMTAPTDLGFIGHLAARFTDRYPDVSVEIVITNRKVDLVAEGFDVALRAGSLVDSSLIARKLGDTRGQLIASPEYLARRGTPLVPNDLASHDVVLFGAQGGGTSWPLSGRDGKVERVAVRGRIAGDDLLFVRAALLAGAGIGLVPQPLCMRDVEEGRLSHVMAEWGTPGGALHVVYPSAKNVSAKVIAFRDLATELFRMCPK